MNTVVVPLISSDPNGWMPPPETSTACIEEFCRLFLEKPPSELLRDSVAESIKAGARAGCEIRAGDASHLRDAWPNGFLVVDKAGHLLKLLGKYIQRHRETLQSPRDRRILEYWERLISLPRPIPTVKRLQTISATDAEGSHRTGQSLAHDITCSLRGNCDAVISFEPCSASFRLRGNTAAATPIIELARSSSTLIRQQEDLQETWHWDRDPHDHCAWLGIAPADVTTRNRCMLGAALAFEERASLFDQYFGLSLCKQVLSDPNSRSGNKSGSQRRTSKKIYQDEWEAYQDNWAPKWLGSVEFLCAAWSQAANECGYGCSRSLTIYTAVDWNWHRQGWFFIARAETLLSNALGGRVSVILRRDKSKSHKSEMHPRYLLTGTRAIQIDRGIDVSDIRRNATTGEDVVTHQYTEVTSRRRHAARYVRELWQGSQLQNVPREHVDMVEWHESMSRWTRRDTR